MKHRISFLMYSLCTLAAGAMFLAWNPSAAYAHSALSIQTQIVDGPVGTAATSGTKGVATATCPAGWSLGGGGFLVPDLSNGNGTVTDVNESRASSTNSNGQTIWSWVVTYRNTGGGSVTARAEAVCQQVDQPTLSVQEVQGSATAITGPNASREASVTCPANTIPVSGGFTANFNSLGGVYKSIRNGNSWVIGAYNYDNSTVTLVPYAYCASVS